MYFVPKTIRLKDGRQALLRSPEPQRDAAELAAVFQTVCGETDFLTKGADEAAVTAQQEENWIAGMNASPKKLMILCEVEGKIAGMCHLAIGENRRNAHRGELGISLLRKYWGLGLGSAMMDELIGAARQKGLSYVELKAIKDNARAVALYEKKGFVVLHETPDAQRLPDGTAQTDLFMRKTL